MDEAGRGSDRMRSRLFMTDAWSHIIPQNLASETTKKKKTCLNRRSFSSFNSCQLKARLHPFLSLLCSPKWPDGRKGQHSYPRYLNEVCDVHILRLALVSPACRNQPSTMKTCRGRLHPWSLGVLFLTALALLFIASSFVKEPSTKPSRYQFIRENKEETFQEMLEKATLHRPVTELPSRVQIKDETADRNTEAARGEGKEKRKVEPVAETLVPGSRGRALTATGTLLTRLEKKVTGRGAVPAEEKVAQVKPSPASSLHPTTQRRQRLKASNFKSEPHWDFEEDYSLDVGGLRTTCPDSLKIRASKSPWLKNIFLPNLTLFLDSAHFTQSEWDRLEHFAPPFGFMELNQSLVQKVVTRIRPVPQQQVLLASLPSGSSRCITCAVVGNGGILNDSHVGQEIDNHDYVFRLSGAITKGYEQDVGTRTSFYGFTAFSVVQSILTLGGRGFQHVPLGKDVRYLHFLEGTRDYEWLEAMFLNQTMAKTKLSWFRYHFPLAPQKAGQTEK